MIRFLPLGGADDIGASCFYLNISGTGIILDSGIHPRKKGIASLPVFELLNDLPVDFAFISHAHQDHIGSLPFLVQRFPHLIIYSTPQTKEIAELTLHNAANILKQNQNEENQLRNYTHEEIELLVRSMRTADYEEPLELKGMRHISRQPVKIVFKDAGHILGSAAIRLEFEDQKIFYTGDINLSSQTIMASADLSGIKTETLITETTYAATDSSLLGTWQSELKRFTRAVNLILQKGGSALVPVFSLGKTQELLASLHLMMKKGTLTETNLYTGGIGKDISNVYDRNRYIIKRKNKELVLKEIPQNNIYEIDDFNYFKKHPGIVLASSGMMLEGTASYKLLDFWLRQDTFAVFGVGYMDPDTPGYKIINSKKGELVQLNLFSVPRKIECEIGKFYFPSHSKREELISIVRKTKPSRVILIHGEEKGKDWLGFNILSKFNGIKLFSADTGKDIVW